jgi:hypothetical protein
MNKKRIILAAVALVVIVVAIPATIYIVNQINKKKNLVFDQNKPILIEKDGKFGYISSTGTVLVEPKYLEADDFFNGKALVTLSYTNEGLPNRQIINTDGSVAMDSVGGTVVILNEEVGKWWINDAIYDKDLKKISPDSMKVTNLAGGYSRYTTIAASSDETVTSGILDSDNKVIYACAINNCAIITAEVSPLLAESYGVVYNPDSKTNTVINLSDTSSIVEQPGLTGVQLIAEGNNIFSVYGTSSELTYAFYVENNKVAFKTNGAEFLTFYDLANKILNVNYQDLYLIEAKTNATETIPNLSLDSSRLTLDGYRLSSCDDHKFGLTKNDKEVVPCENQYVRSLPEAVDKFVKNSLGKDLVIVIENSTSSYLLNIKNGEKVATFGASAQIGSKSTFVLARTDDKTTVYSLVTGKTKDFEPDASISTGVNYIAVSKTEGGQIIYYDTSFNEIYRN